ncbi:MAG: lysophospholipid acyltransferase family protein [Burkholderiaceae bacterium]
MFALARWLSRRPLWLLHGVGAALGWLAYACSPSYRHRFVGNARQAGVSAAAARPAIAQAGRAIMEMPYLWLRPANQRIAPEPQLIGTELVEAAHARGRGIVFLTPHLGCFEITAQAIAQHYAAQHGPITVLYRPARATVLRDLMDRTRARPGLATAPATLAGVRQLLRALRRGESVGLLPDQVPPEGMGVWAPFFGKPAYTMTLAARLVQQTGAVPLLVWGERLGAGRGFTVHFLPFDEALPADPQAQAESAAAVNLAMQRLILKCPEQYLWGYHRYKRPRGADDAGTD